MDKKDQKPGRRRIIQGAVAGTVGAVTLPEKWVKPVIQSVIVPAHAATSPIATSTTPAPTTTLVTSTTLSPTTTIVVTTTTTPAPTTTN